MSEETLTHIRNPLFVADAYITPDRCLTVDWQHGLSLGVFQQFTAHVVHALFRANAWETAERTEEGRLAMSTALLRAELFAWYAEQQRAGLAPTQVTDLTPTMLGNVARPSLNFKASETNHFLRFLHDLLIKYKHKLEEGEATQKACDALLRCLALIHEHPHIFPPRAIKDHTSRAQTHNCETKKNHVTL